MRARCRWRTARSSSPSCAPAPCGPPRPLRHPPPPPEPRLSRRPQRPSPSPRPSWRPWVPSRASGRLPSGPGPSSPLFQPWISSGRDPVFLSLLADRGLLLAGDGLARTLASARVGVRPLAPHREVAAVPHPPVAADVDQPLDVHLDVLAQVSFDLALFLDDVADPAHLVLRQVLDLDALAHPRLAEDAIAARPADPEAVGQRDLDPLVLRQVHTVDACH